MAIIGAILGDIAGSQYEYDRPKDLDWEMCELFTKECSFTDDTVMTLAVKNAIDQNLDFETAMRQLGKNYPYCGYGNTFFEWIFCTNPHPYNSFGNGAAMRVSYIGEFFEKFEDVVAYSKKSAEVSHNHPEGIKGAVTTAVCVWMAKHKKSKNEIYEYVLSQYQPEQYPFSIDKELSYLEQYYSWDVKCQTSVPVAMRCFYESESYESFLRNVFRLECDMDTLCAIGGGVAEEYYGKTGFKNHKILEYYLDERLMQILNNVEVMVALPL